MVRGPSRREHVEGDDEHEQPGRRGKQIAAHEEDVGQEGQQGRDGGAGENDEGGLHVVGQILFFSGRAYHSMAPGDMAFYIDICQNPLRTAARKKETRNGL